LPAGRRRRHLGDGQRHGRPAGRALRRVRQRRPRRRAPDQRPAGAAGRRLLRAALRRHAQPDEGSARPARPYPGRPRPAAAHARRRRRAGSDPAGARRVETRGGATLDSPPSDRSETTMDLGIRGKNAIVCAASKGLGKGCALSLAREGVNITMNARTKDALEAAAKEIRDATGVRVTTVAGDVTTDAVRTALLQACPNPDILVNNAGGPPPGDFREWDRDAWLRALDANMLTPIFLIKATVDGMIARRFGRIVNITSVSVKATGRSIEDVTRERQAQNPAGRFGTAAEFGEVCAFVCSAQAGYITGQNFVLDGGAYPGTL